MASDVYLTFIITPIVVDLVYTLFTLLSHLFSLPWRIENSFMTNWQPENYIPVMTPSACNYVWKGSDSPHFRLVHLTDVIVYVPFMNKILLFHKWNLFCCKNPLWCTRLWQLDWSTEDGEAWLPTSLLNPPQLHWLESNAIPRIRKTDILDSNRSGLPSTMQRNPNTILPKAWWSGEN